MIIKNIALKSMITVSLASFLFGSFSVKALETHGILCPENFPGSDHLFYQNDKYFTDINRNVWLVDYTHIVKGHVSQTDHIMRVHPSFVNHVGDKCFYELKNERDVKIGGFDLTLHKIFDSHHR
ncbi:MAG: hypothetical protein JSS34_01305 [Proteobacteria bacterium]|nr:hypothetical protein [Pseudomonadota bacterium]